MSERGALAATFRAELAGGEPATDGDLERELAAACALGHRVFAQIALDDWTFVRHLARVFKRDANDEAALSALALEDLFLSCACLEGDAAATAIFRARYRTTIVESIRSIVPAADVDDVHGQFVQELLVGTAATSPKLASYAGRASLDRWLGVGARRAALMWLRKSQAEGRARRAAATDPEPGDANNVESAYLKERYRGAFERALGEALKRLPERDRVVLRLSLVNGVSVEKIGTMFKVSQSTVSRWLAAARGTLLDDVKETLRRRLGASSSELASLARMVASRLDLTLPSFLKQA
ncbi:MAG TPA: sigma-70 family RNA polymerase sigma factor [Polyangia bacterium]|nr:sigma-70 family RNA polymerase sigma factor [Polyangia bacterium]